MQQGKTRRAAGGRDLSCRHPAPVPILLCRVLTTVLLDPDSMLGLGGDEPEPEVVASIKSVAASGAMAARQQSETFDSWGEWQTCLLVWGAVS